MPQTTKKKKTIANPEQFIWREEKFKSKYSQCFEAAQQKFTPSYNVIKLKYWRKYRLITHFDCSLYDTLLLYARENIGFTQDELRIDLGVGKTTLRQSLDNLINAELIEEIKLRDKQGERNYYIMKSPLYDEESFTAEKAKKIRIAGETVPTVFLESQVVRLRRQIKKNSFKKMRTALSDISNLKGSRLEAAQNIRSLNEERQLTWKLVQRNFGENAAIVDNLVWEIVRIEGLHKLDELSYRKRFIEIFKDWLKGAGITKWKSYFETCAIKLMEFYRKRIKPKSSGNSEPPPPKYVAARDAEMPEHQTLPKEVDNPKWKEVRTILKKELPKVGYEWFEHVACVSVDSEHKILTLSTNQMCREWIETNYSNELNEAFNNVGLKGFMINWELK